MRTAQKILKRTAIVVLCLIGLVTVFLATRKPWVKPLVPGVQLSPTRPILRPEDVDPNGAFGKLQVGLKALEAVATNLTFENGILDAAKVNPLDPNIESALLKYEPGMSLVRDAVKIEGGRQAPFVPVSEFRMDYLGPGRNAHRIFCASAHHKAAKGDIDGALDDIQVSMEVGELIGSGGAFVPLLVNIQIINESCLAMWDIAWRYDVSEDQYRLAIGSLSQAESALEPFIEALRYECTFASNEIDWLNDVTIRGTVVAPHLTLKVEPSWASRITDISRLLGSDANTSRANINSAYSYLILSEQNSSVWRKLDAGLLIDVDERTALRTLSRRDPGGLILARCLLTVAELSHRRYYHSRFSLRATSVALALDQYEQTRGAPPSRLEELVPKYLAKIPDDPFLVGATLRFKSLPDGHWMIYSVGTNGVDDGGVFDEGRTTGLDIGISTLHFIPATNGVGE